MVLVNSTHLSGIGHAAPQAAARPSVGGHSWKATLSAFVRRAGETAASGVQSFRALVTRDVTVRQAPTQPRVGQRGDPGISAPTPQKTRDALVARATVDMLPPALRDSEEFKDAVADVRSFVREAGSNLDRAMTRLGALLLAPQPGMEAALGQLALSDGRDFVASILGVPSLDNLPPVQRNALLAGFDRIASGLPDQQVGGDQISVGGQLYKKEKVLGQGNFGAVLLYVAVAPRGEKSPEKLAVKISRGNEVHANLDPDEAMRRNMVEGPLAEARAMVNATGTGAGSGADNMLKLHGVVHAMRDPDANDLANGVTKPYGVVMLATEFAGAGAGIDVAASLNKLLASQKITPAQHRAAMLTLLQDMLKAGQRQDEAKGMVHFDYRPDNMLVTSEGVLKVGDRGLNVTLDEGQRQNSGAAESATQDAVAIGRDMKMPIKWMAPEIFRNNGAAATGKSDVWSAGISLYEMLHTQDLTPHPHPLGFESVGIAQARTLLEKGPLPRPFSGQPVNGRYVESNGRVTEESLGQLIRAMLDPNAATRPSFGELLQNEVFDEPGVGSAGTRALIGGAHALLHSPAPAPAPAPPAQANAAGPGQLYVGPGPSQFYAGPGPRQVDSVGHNDAQPRHNLHPDNLQPANPQQDGPPDAEPPQDDIYGNGPTSYN